MTPRRALVVGAGIGGLAAAIALTRAGWQVRVLERASTPRELGFALLLAPNAMTTLRDLGLADVVRAGGVVTTGGEMRQPGGRILRRFDASDAYRLIGEPPVVTLRQVLHGALLDTVGESSLALDSKVVGAELGDDGVALRLAGGERVTGDVLIGADGVGSAVRTVLHPGEGPARRSGLIAVRGVAHDVADGDRYVGCQYFGRGVEAGLARAGARAFYWYLSLPDGPEYAARDRPALIRRLMPQFERQFQQIVEATRADDMRLDELFDRDPLAAWGHGRATLLGDAAHPMLPHAGQGAAQALEDAVTLGRALKNAPDMAAALRRYERIRAPRTAAVVAIARRNAALGALRNSVACALRDTVIRLVPKRVILRSLIAFGNPQEDIDAVEGT